MMQAARSLKNASGCRYMIEKAQEFLWPSALLRCCDQMLAVKLLWVPCNTHV